MSQEPDPAPRTESLADAFRRGEQRSFDPLYERLAPALFAWAALRAPRGVDPRDLVGEVWLQAVRSFDLYDPERAGFRAWIFGIAKKMLLRVLRDLERGADGGRAAEPPDLGRIPESVTSLTRRFERDESISLFLARVAEFGEEERELVIYCGLEGFTCGEAATRLGLSEDATTKRWQRLRAELRSSSWAECLLA